MTFTKEMTALNTSVGADAGQSHEKSNNTITQTLTADYKNVRQMGKLPDQLRENGRFCCWRYEERNGCRTKVPYNPVTGQMARSNDRSSFSDFQTAVAAKGYEGIGIGIFDGICAIDLDHCVKDGQYTGNAAEIVALMHSYTELSPSGEGVHILFRADGFRYDSGRYYIMNHKEGIEAYVAGATNKYVTVTGRACEAYAFGDRTEELKILLERFMKRPERKSEAAAGNAINTGNAVSADVSLPDLEEIIALAKASRSGNAFSALWEGSTVGYSSHSEADMALCSYLAFWTGKDAAKMDALFRRSGLMREKWNRGQSGSTYGALTIRRAIAQCGEVYTPRRKETARQRCIPSAVMAEEAGAGARMQTTAIAEQETLKKDKAQDKIQSGAADEQKQPEASAGKCFAPVVPLVPECADLPKFPIDALPEVVRDYVAAVAENSQTSPDMAAVISLGVLASCLQGKFVVEGRPGYCEPLNLYTVVVAAPGERKSSVMKSMTKYLYEYEQAFNEGRKAELRRNRQERESLERQIAGIKKKLETKPDTSMELELQQLEAELEEMEELKPVRFFADDCSSEALTSLIANNNGILSVISTEGGIFDIMAGRYSGKPNIDVWLKGHCGDEIYIDRMGRAAERIHHPALTAILSIQPSVLNEIMENPNMNGRGLIARFLYSCPASRIGTRTFRTPPVPEKTAERYRKLIFSLMAAPVPEEPLHLHLTEGATDVIAECFAEHEKYLLGEGQAIADWGNKYIGAVLRIAGLLHGAEMSSAEELISAETIRRAVQIGQYFLAHSAYAYSMMGGDLNVRKAKFVLAKLKKFGRPEVKRTELFQVCRGKFFRKTEEIDPTLELLEEHGYLLRIPQEYKGIGRKPDTIVRMNPEAA